jgi:hypothetical protein
MAPGRLGVEHEGCVPRAPEGTPLLVGIYSKAVVALEL